MKLRNILLFLFGLLFISIVNAQVNGHLERKMAIYLPDANNDVNYSANLSSIKQLSAVTGISSTITANFSECLSYGVILFATPVDDLSLSVSQEDMLMTYVENGGCVIFSGLEDNELLEFAGIESVDIRQDKYYMSFVSSIDKKELRWIDDEYEREIKLGSSDFGDIISSYNYYLADGSLFAEFRNGGAGLVKTQRGNGLVYTFGLLWRDMILRNNLNRDFNANRKSSNAFEATSDVVMLLVRGMYTEAIPNAVWISPAPYDSKGVLLITHDIASHTSQIFANDFAELESSRGILGTFNITTHNFKEEIAGDSYTSHIAQMKLIKSKNHSIGSLNYGHFPDFDNPDVFPVGELLTSANDYNPYYSITEKRTIGGTVYGEIGVSKMILEEDLETAIIMHRSPFLDINPLQYNVLNELRFLYSSSFSASNILTGFPSYAHENIAMNGEELPILEMGVTISDRFHPYAMDEINWEDKAQLWVSVTEKYANNNAFSNVMIQTNRSYKVKALEYLLDHMSSDIYPMELTQYGDFWKKKNTIKYSSIIENNVLKVYLNETALSDEMFSFTVDFPNDLEAIEVYDNNGDLQSYHQKDYYLGTSLLYQKSFKEVQNKAIAFNEEQRILLRNYPNPFTYYTNIEYVVEEEANIQIQVYDIYGRLVKELVNDHHLPGVYHQEFGARNIQKGIYFNRMTIQNSISNKIITKKMLIN